MASKTHIFRVEMTCEGCANTITNVLNKHRDRGIQNFNVNLKEKTVTIQSILDSNELTGILRKTGKAVTYMGEKR